MNRNIRKTVVRLASIFLLLVTLLIRGVPVAYAVESPFPATYAGNILFQTGVTAGLAAATEEETVDLNMLPDETLPESQVDQEQQTDNIITDQPTDIEDTQEIDEANDSFDATVNVTLENSNAATLEPSLTFTPSQGKPYHITANATNIGSSSSTEYILSYDPTVLQLTDLCAFTLNKELTATGIPLAGIEVTSVASGQVKFILNKNIPSTMVWTGVLTTFEFTALRTQPTTVEINLADTPATPVATSIEFTGTPYSAQIPASGNTKKTVTAVVKDQYGNVMSSLKPTLSISPAYSGVAIVSSTGVVTIQSTAAAGTATVQATCGSLTATTPLTLTKAAPVATSIAFTGTPYSAQIPASGNTKKTVTAVVKDQYGNVMSSLKPTLSISPAYSGVTIVSSTGVVTIQSTTAAGTATVQATYGSLTATTPLTLTSSSTSTTYTLAFDQAQYEILLPIENNVTVSAIARKNGSTVVTAPELVSIVYSCNGTTNTTGLFWEDGLSGAGDPVTAVATFSNGATAQATSWIYFGYIPPSAAPDNEINPDAEILEQPVEQFSARMMRQTLEQQIVDYTAQEAGKNNLPVFWQS